MAVGRKSPRLSQLYFGKTVVEDTPSMRYEVILFIILFFFIIILDPFCHYPGIPDIDVRKWCPRP